YQKGIMIGHSRIRIYNRSTLETYMEIMNAIRTIFSRETAQHAGLLSFKSIGACPVCHGKGVTTPDVAFADPVTIRFEACGGSRYSNKALSYRYQHKNIAEVLDLTIDEAMTYLTLHTFIKKIIIL